MLRLPTHFLRNRYIVLLENLSNTASLDGPKSGKSRKDFLTGCGWAGEESVKYPG